MLRYGKILLLLCILALAAGGCTGAPGQPAGLAEGAKEGLVVAAAAADPGGTQPWTRLSEYSGDVDGDGAEEKVTLRTTAGRSQGGKGEIMWDDGQPWQLVVTDGGQFYALLDEFIQLGSVYFTVAQDDAGKTKIMVIVSTGAGFEMAAYTYDKEQNGYRKEAIYNSSGINLLHSSLPGYR